MGMRKDDGRATPGLLTHCDEAFGADSTRWRRLVEQPFQTAGGTGDFTQQHGIVR